MTRNILALRPLSALSTIVALTVSQVALAQTGSLVEAVTDGKLLLNLRPRYEYVEQDNKAKEANAFTLRSLLGWKTKSWHDVSATAEGINVTHLGPQRFNDNAALSSPYPLVADPEDTDLNQWFVDYTGIAKTTARVGRQSIKLDNVRFIGNVEFRQVMQVFNAATIDYQGIDGLRVYGGYLFRLKTIAGMQRKTQTPIVNVRYSFRPGQSIVGYGYWQNQPNTGQVTGFADNSNRILGVRLDGAHPLGAQWKVQYTAEFAKQDRYAGGDTRIDARYRRVGVGAQWKDAFLRVDQEVLGSNNGLYGFQTPLGTNHLFQGWADQLLSTPRQGIKDRFLTAGAKFGPVALLSEYHQFDADSGSLDFGKEFDAGLVYNTPVKGLYAKLEFADYKGGDAATGKVDTRKVWMTVGYGY